jgi:hypothetical protein
MTEKLGFDSWQRKYMFLFSTKSKQTLGFSQVMQWISGDLSPDVKLLGCEAHHSPSSRAEVKNEWRYTPFPPCVCVVRFVKFAAAAVITYGTRLNTFCQGSFII